MTTRYRCPLIASTLAIAGLAHGQPAAVMRDLDAFSPKTLSKAEAQQLLVGAKVSRIVGNGNRHVWTNEPDGTFVVISDNRNSGGRPSRGQGKWHVTDDGRYCVLIEWRTANADEWCRFLLDTTDGYYMTKSTSVMTEKVYKLEIDK